MRRRNGKSFFMIIAFPTYLVIMWLERSLDGGLFGIRLTNKSGVI